MFIILFELHSCRSCIAGDEFSIILGLSNNCLRIVSWNGEVGFPFLNLPGFVQIDVLICLLRFDSGIQ